MSNTDLEKVKALRNKLRNGRTTISQSAIEPDSITIGSSSSDIERYTPKFSATNGTSIQPIKGQEQRTHGTSESVAGTQRRTDDQPRSTSPLDLRERLKSRRSGSNNGAGRADGTNVSGSIASSERGIERKAGNLVTIETIPERHFKPEQIPITSKTTDAKTTTESTISSSQEPRTRGRKSKIGAIKLLGISTPTSNTEAPKGKQEAPTEKSQGFLAGLGSKALSKQEAALLEEPLADALEREFELMDRAINGYAKDANPLEQPIWSDMTKENVSILAHGLLRLGQQSPTAATIARTAVNADSYIQTALIIAPRFQKSVMLIQEQNAIKKVQRGEVVENRTRRNWLRGHRRDAEQITE